MTTEPDSTVVVSFQVFFDGWLVRQQAFLDQLHLCQNAAGNTDDQRKSLIDKVISHYQQLYDQKARGARDDVVLFFTPPWLSSLERTLLWIGGDKPSLMVKLASSSDLTEEQARRLEGVRGQVKREERELMEAMATVQESLAAPPLLNLARRFGRLVDGEVADLDSAMEVLKVMMLDALERADALRGSTVRRIVEILSPVQTVRFLAGAAEFLLRIRKWGLQRDAQREADTTA